MKSRSIFQGVKMCWCSIFNIK